MRNRRNQEIEWAIADYKYAVIEHEKYRNVSLELCAVTENNMLKAENAIYEAIGNMEEYKKKII